jgi:hypothetical protein
MLGFHYVGCFMIKRKSEWLYSLTEDMIVYSEDLIRFILHCLRKTVGERTKYLFGFDNNLKT